jgi:hypothetical protein
MGFNSGSAGDGFAANPGLRRARPERQREEADGLLEFAVQVARKQVAHRREPRHVFRIADLPFALNLRLGLVGLGRFAGEHPHPRVVGFGDLPLLVDQAGVRCLLLGNREGHVGLPAAEPHLAHQNIVDDDRVVPGDGHLERTARFQTLQPDHPFAVRRCGGGLLLAVERHRDPFAGAATPQTGTAMPLCSTMWSLKRADGLTSASSDAVAVSKRKTVSLTVAISTRYRVIVRVS